MIVDLSRRAAQCAGDEEFEISDEKQAVADAREWLAGRGGKGIPHEEAMQRLGRE